MTIDLKELRAAHAVAPVEIQLEHDSMTCYPSTASVCFYDEAMLRVPELIDEVERLRATLAQPHHEWAAGQHSVGVDIAAEDKRIRDENDGLRARLAAAEAANASIQIVDHVELNGHVDIAEQCRDWIARLDADEPSGKLQDFAASLRIVIDQLDRQRRQRNWYEVAYTAGKQKLIEAAVDKAMTGVEELKAKLAAMTAARDEACRIAGLALGNSNYCEAYELRRHERIAELRAVGSKAGES